MFERLKSACPKYVYQYVMVEVRICNQTSTNKAFRKKYVFPIKYENVFFNKYVLPSFEHLKKVDKPHNISRETEANVAEVRNFTDRLIFLLNFLFFYQM